MHRGSRYLTAILALGLAAAQVACSSSSDAGSKSHRVAFVVANSQLNFANEMAIGFRNGVSQVGGVEQTVVGPPTVDGPKELQMFQDQTKASKDGVSVFTMTPDLFAAPLAKAAKDGIPMIAVDNPPPPSSNVKLFVGNDNYALGQMLADEVIAKLPASAAGKIMIGTSTPGVPVLDRRAAGERDELRKKLPGVTVIGPFDTKQDTAANEVAWATLVKANPTALAFLGTGDADGWNLAAIRKSTHGTWLAGAFDLDPRSLQAVRDGDLILVSPEHLVKGSIAGRLQAEHAKTGKPLPEGWIYTPGLAVNQSNIDVIIARQATPASRAAVLNTQVDKILKDPSYLRPMTKLG